MRLFSALLLCSAGAGAFVSPVYAQDAGPAVSDASLDGDVIIVQARRRDEDVQDVPAVIDTVTANEIAKLNLRDFKEVQTLVPGLSLNSESNGVGGSAKLRGVNFDINASGFNSTVEFYLNDAPITAGLVLQQMFDIGQIEVQRGPQGTLRGRASPSGSITVTARKPNLHEIGGAVDMTANTIGGLNFKGALNVPIIDGVAAIRVAGVWDENEADRVRPLSGGRDPFARTQAGRVSALLQPTDWLKLEGMYQRMERNARTYDQAESLSVSNPDAAASPTFISGKDRLSIREAPREIRQVYDVFNWRAEASLAGQSLIYQGQQYKQDLTSTNDTDEGNFFADAVYNTLTHSKTKSTSHEIRLQNADRVLDMFDYVVGYFRNDNAPPTDLDRMTIVRLPVAFGGGVAQVVTTPISRTSKSKERSFFGNLTLHIGDATEVSGGLRHIDYSSASELIVGGRLLTTTSEDAKKWIYNASVKHNFTPDLMVYASTGSSFRPGVNITGDFNIAPSALENSFLHLAPESSRSYEIGLKSTMLDGRLRMNLSAYHQKFKNYPYRVPNGVYYVNTTAVRDATGAVTGTVQDVGNFNFAGAVPAEVNGVEGDIFFQASDAFSIGLVASYSLGKIKNGVIPCNDLDGDGRPDATVSAPSLTELKDAVGADNLSACSVNQRAGFSSPFSATLQGEYQVPISGKVDGYLRGLVSYNGKSKVDPSSIFDDVDGYALANIYAGVRDPDGAWEVSLFAKNVFNTFKVLSRGTPLFTSYQQLGFAGEFANGKPVFTGPTAATFSSSYLGVTSTPPREFGVNVRFAFGSR